MKKRTLSNAESSYYKALQHDTLCRKYIANVKPIGTIEKAKGGSKQKKEEA